VRFSARIFLAYFALLGIALWFVMRSFSQELVPGMRQSLEETLNDTANLMAEVVRDEVAAGTITSGEFSRQMTAFSRRHIDAVIWFFHKRDPNLMVYITDRHGIVLYDSRGRDVGRDYSQWNDVYLTLRGRYGARSSRDDPADEFSSVMYVAAPIVSGGNTIGVLTVGKPSVAVQPFVEAALNNIREKGLWLLLAALLVGAGLSHWLTLSIRRLTAYARAVQEGRRVAMPRLRETELAQLASAMEAMRSELEGKDYVERYLLTLTHELKSPLAAIQGAAELLGEEMAPEQRARFIANIQSESGRLRQVVERLLHLAALEKRQGLERVEEIDLAALLRQLVEDKAPVSGRKALRVAVDAAPVVVRGERFLLQQAISNLLDNAIEFSPPGAPLEVTLGSDDGQWILRLRDHGPGIPDYARGRLFESFYSLPRPDTGRKSTGLGLSLVREAVTLHGGVVDVDNHPGGGAIATLRAPLSP
jgi:two-component system sensor histidine kinase CreC